GLLAQLGGATDDLPRLAWRSRIAGYHREAVAVPAQHPPPAAILAIILSRDVVAGRLPVSIAGVHPEGLPDIAHGVLLLGGLEESALGRRGAQRCHRDLPRCFVRGRSVEPGRRRTPPRPENRFFRETM